MQNNQLAHLPIGAHHGLVDVAVDLLPSLGQHGPHLGVQRLRINASNGSNGSNGTDREPRLGQGRRFGVAVLFSAHGLRSKASANTAFNCSRRSWMPACMRA